MVRTREERVPWWPYVATQSCSELASLRNTCLARTHTQQLLRWSLVISTLAGLNYLLVGFYANKFTEKLQMHFLPIKKSCFSIIFSAIIQQNWMKFVVHHYRILFLPTYTRKLFKPVKVKISKVCIDRINHFCPLRSYWLGSGSILFECR